MSAAASTRPAFDWDALMVGEEFGPFQYELPAELVNAYRRAVGDHELELVDGIAVAPPTILTFAFLHLIEHKYQPHPGGVHAEQEFAFMAPLRVGAVLTVTGVLTAMELRRGRGYFTLTASAEDDARTEVARARVTGVHPRGPLPGGRVPDLDRSPAVASSSEPNARQVWARRSTQVSGDVVRAYGEVADDFNPIHFDDAAAQAAGLPRRSAHGMIAGAAMSALLTREYGVDWLTRGHLSVKFIRPVSVGQTIEVRIEGEGDPEPPFGRVVSVDVDDEAEQRVIVGRAWLAGSRRSPLPISADQ